MVHTLLVFLTVVGSALAHGTPGLALLPWVATVAVLVGTIVLGRAMDAALRDEIRAGTAKVTRS